MRGLIAGGAAARHNIYARKYIMTQTWLKEILCTKDIDYLSCKY